MSYNQLSAFPVTAYIQKVFGAPVESPQTLFPHKPYRTVWNEEHPDIHTISEAVKVIVQREADQYVPISPLEINEKLMEMGFEEQNVQQTIQPMMSLIKGIKRCKRRYYPPAKPGQKPPKSWATYSYGWAADVIDQKDTETSIALAKSGVMARIMAVAENCAMRGDDFFTKDSNGE